MHYFIRLRVATLCGCVAFLSSYGLLTHALSNGASGHDLVERALHLEEVRSAVDPERPYTYGYVLYKRIGGHVSQTDTYSVPKFLIFIRQPSLEKGASDHIFPISYTRSTIQADHGFQQQWVGLSSARLKAEITRNFSKDEDLLELSYLACDLSDENSDLKLCLWKDVVAKTWDAVIGRYIYGNNPLRVANSRREAVLNYYSTGVQQEKREELSWLEDNILGFRKISLVNFLPNELRKKYSKAYLVTWESKSRYGSLIPKLILVQERGSSVWKGAPSKLKLAEIHGASSKDAKKAFDICKEQLEINDSDTGDASRNLRAHIASRWFRELAHLLPEDLNYQNTVENICNDHDPQYSLLATPL